MNIKIKLRIGLIIATCCAFLLILLPFLIPETTINDQFTLYSCIYAVLIIDLLFLFLISDYSKDEYKKKSLENELNLIKSQMNPHFLFNSLNSLQNLMLNEQNEKAIEGFSTFTKLLRQMLEYSSLQNISLEQEIEFITLYTNLESMRFKDKFSITINADINIDPHQTKLPPMIIQPLIENAINHGLMHREESGELMIYFSMQGDNLICTITDNGVGREQAKKIKEESGNTNQSKGTSLVIDRIDLLNKLKKDKKKKYLINFRDAFNDKQYLGTKVELVIPQI